jgi:hypothetical protein
MGVFGTVSGYLMDGFDISDVELLGFGNGESLS